MLIYLAGLGTIAKTYKDWLGMFQDPLPELQSYWEIRNFDGHSLKKFGEPYLLDSGAFSAQRENVTIDVKDYAKYLQKYGEQCTGGYINLDKIPTKCSVDEAAFVTLQNQDYLESLGLTPIPVYHKGEDEKFLDIILDRGYEYMACGGLVDTGDEAGMDDFFDHIWKNKLTNPDGSPKLRVHAFGMTNISLMQKYPWYSCDSSTWLIQSRLGWQTIPKRGANGWLWNEKPQQVAVSNESAARKLPGKHYDTMTKAQQETIDLWINEFHPEVNIDTLRDHPAPRLALNIYYWVQLQKNATWCTHYKTNEFSLL